MGFSLTKIDDTATNSVKQEHAAHIMCKLIPALHSAPEIGGCNQSNKG